MTALCIIFGIILIIGGFCCMFTPLTTFINVEYFIVIFVTVFGIIGFIKGIVEKRFGANFIFSILSMIFGIIVLCFPKLMIFTDGVLLYMVAAWFILQGILSVITAVTVTRTAGGGLWVLQLIFGILGILLGCYSFFRPMVLAISLGLLIGIYFIETGFTLIFASTNKN